MNLSLATKTTQQHTLVLGVYEDGSLTATGKHLDKAEKGLLSQLIKNKTVSGRCGECLPVLLPNAKHQPAVLLVGCGKSNAVKESDYRKLITAAVNTLNSLQIKAA